MTSYGVRYYPEERVSGRARVASDAIFAIRDMVCTYIASVGVVATAIVIFNYKG